MVDTVLARDNSHERDAPRPEAPVAGTGLSAQPSRAAVGLLVGFLVLYLTWQLWRWLPGGRHLIGDAFFVPATAAAIFTAWRASTRGGVPGRLRSAWRLIALAWAAFLGGALAQLLYELNGPTPYPSITDGLYLLFYPLMLLGLLRFPTARRTGSDRVRLGLDLATVAIGGSTVVWYVVLGPTAIATGHSALETTISIAYPVGDMVLVVGLCSLLLRGAMPASRRALELMTVALLFFVAADLVYGNAILHGTYQGGDPVDSLWIVAITLAAVAGLAQRPLVAGVASVIDPGIQARREHASWLPYLAVAAGGALLVFSERHAHFFPTFSLVISVVVLMTLVTARQLLANRDLERSDAELRAAHHALSALATTDSLTGLPNHRGLVASLDSELERCRRYDRPFGLLFIDLDHFKAINDSLGHGSGDAALRELGQVISGALRGIDILGRWGGEEFIAVIPEADPATAHAAAERIRSLVATHSFQCVETWHLTCSIGIASYPEHGVSRDELLGRADDAMYAAKHLGRNRALLAGDPEMHSAVDQPLPTSSNQHVPLEGIDALAAVVDARDQYTGRHSAQVAVLAERLASILDRDPDQTAVIVLAARLHDIGKVGVPDTILNKAGTLTPREWRLINEHPAIGANIAGLIPSLQETIPIIRGHHERFDGTGYPDRLARHSIPLGARIIAVADAYHAITSDRPYQSRRGHDHALAEIQRCAGTQFDPQVVTALQTLLAPANVTPGQS